MKKTINMTAAIIEVLKKYSSERKNEYTHPLTYKEIYQYLIKEYPREAEAFGISEKMVYTCVNNIINFETYIDNKNKTICYKNYLENSDDIDETEDKKYRSKLFTPKQISDYELKFLIDSVMYSKIFSSKTAQEFARRVQQLSGKNLKAITNYLHENSFGKQRHFTEINVLDNIQSIINAINENRFIMMDFFNYDVEKDAVKLRIQQKDSVLYPLQLVLNDGRYVLLAHYRGKEKVYNFNVDLISNVRLLERNEHNCMSDNIKNNFIRAQYILQHPFLMGGEAKVYKIRVKRESFSRVVDTFSYNIKVISNTTTEETVDIIVKSSELGIIKWILTNYEIAEVINPDESLKKELRSALEQLSKNIQ